MGTDVRKRLVFGAPALAALLMAAPLPAAAHPHVTVVAKAAFVLDSKGQITAIRHQWTFDEAYSAFAVTGMKKGPDGKTAPEELKDLAKLNVESLSEFAYFTQMKKGKKALEFNTPKTGYYLEDTGKALVLHFVLPLKASVAPSSDTTLRVDDETFFVAFSFDEKDPASIDGATPCKIEVKRPAKAADQSMQKLGEDFFNNLKSGFTDDYATTIKLACP
jgi:ABC-type uncharacterized transport system substrate-binding protein